jgi:aerobic carbon-monoxide dehydrogenase medium subunit
VWLRAPPLETCHRGRCDRIGRVLLREVSYARPATVEEAVSLLSEHDGARALAGGQTLVNVMKQRAASPDVLVDLADIEELRAVTVSGTTLEIGAMATLTALMRSSEVEVSRPILAEVAATVADVQVRNRGTLGGNICVNDPTNHFPPLLVALGARMTIRDATSERTVPAEEFFVGVFETAVREGDLLTRIDVPAAGKGTGDGMSGVTLGAHGTYIANAAASVVDGRWRIALGCVAAVPVRAAAVEAGLGGVDVDESSVRAAVAGLGETLDPPSDVHASADYRRALAETSVVRAVLQAAERAKG